MSYPTKHSDLYTAELINAEVKYTFRKTDNMQRFV